MDLPPIRLHGCPNLGEGIKNIFLALEKWHELIMFKPEPKNCLTIDTRLWPLQGTAGRDFFHSLVSNPLRGILSGVVASIIRFYSRN